MILDSQSNKKLFREKTKESYTHRYSQDKSYSSVRLHNKIWELHDTYKLCRIAAYKNEQWNSCFAWTILEWEIQCFGDLFNYSEKRLGISIEQVLSDFIEKIYIPDTGGKQITRVLKRCGLREHLEIINSEIEYSFQSFFEPLLPAFSANGKSGQKYFELPVEERIKYPSNTGESLEKFFKKKSPKHYASIEGLLSHAALLEPWRDFFSKYLQETDPSSRVGVGSNILDKKDPKRTQNADISDKELVNKRPARLSLRSKKFWKWYLISTFGAFLLVVIIIAIINP